MAIATPPNFASEHLRRKAAPYHTSSNNFDSSLTMSPHKQTADRVDRTSFSSIKESDDGVAQSFTTTKTSSYLSRPEDEEAISDGLPTPPIEISGLLTNPQSALLGFVCPCNGFKGWKAISIRGKVASKSSGDLRSLSKGFDWEIRRDVEVAKKKDEGSYEAGQAPFELLPMELLSEFPF